MGVNRENPSDIIEFSAQVVDLAIIKVVFQLSTCFLIGSTLQFSRYLIERY